MRRRRSHWGLGLGVLLLAVVGHAAPITAAPSIEGEIAYLEEGPGGLSLRLVNADGTNRRLVVPDLLEGSCINAFFNGSYPTWSPDGSRIAVSQPQPASGVFETYVVDVEANTANQLAVPVLVPRWSPDGTALVGAEIVFDPVFGFFDTSGSIAIVPLSAVSAADVQPVTPGLVADWSPDGSTLIAPALGSATTTFGGFDAINPSTSDTALAVDDPGEYGLSIDVSAAGGLASIAYDPVADSYDIAVTQLTFGSPGSVDEVGGPAFEIVSSSAKSWLSVSWSPDGTSLATTQLDTATGLLEGVFLVDPGDGSSVQVPGLGPGTCFPAWRPYGQAGGSSSGPFSVTTGDGVVDDGDPLETTIDVPVGGSVTVNEFPAAGPAPAGFSLAGFAADITLNPDASIVPADPAVFTFLLDTSALSGPFTVFKDGLALGSCSESGQAVPDPCVESQGPSGVDDWEIVVNTTSASVWQFGIPIGPVCTIVGTDGDDVLRGTSGDDVICGLGGDDRLRGFGGNDILIGGEGDDVLIGSRGNDELFGGEGDDRLRGGFGHDYLDGGPGRDALIGGPGVDVLIQ